MALAQPVSADLPDTMNRVLLGIFGLSSSTFANTYGKGAWIAVFGAFGIVFGIVYAASHYLPFFKEEGNRSARIIFSIGLGILGLVTPGYLDLLADLGEGALTILAVVALLILIVFVIWELILNRGQRQAEHNANVTEQTARRAEAGLRSVQATATGDRATAEAAAVVAREGMQADFHNTGGAIRGRETNRLAAETTQQNAQVAAIVNQSAQGLVQLQHENTRRINQINADADNQHLTRDERQARINQNQETFDQTIQERIDTATRTANAAIAQEARTQNWDNERVRLEQARVTDQIEQQRQRMLEMQATTQTNLLRQQQDQATVQRQLDAQQRLLLLETRSFNQLVTHVNASLNTAGTVVDKVNQINRALGIAGGVTDTRTAMNLISPLATEISNLQQFSAAVNSLMTELTQYDSEIRGLQLARTLGRRAPRGRQAQELQQLETVATTLRTQAEQENATMMAEAQGFSREVTALNDAINTGSMQNATRLAGALQTQAARLMQRESRIRDLSYQASEAIINAQTLIGQIRATP